MTGSSSSTSAAARPVAPPLWLFAATGLLTLGTLAMAVAETTLWVHYLIDAGESISLIGLLFLLGAGWYLFGRNRLAVSLPLAVPWLLLPVITQGDQIIDNLSINGMRLVTHLLLALLFAAPVGVAVWVARFAADGRAESRVLRMIPGLRQIAMGRTRQGSAVFAALLFAAEIWIASRFLGLLMVITLLLLIAAALIYGFAGGVARPRIRGARSERLALGLLLVGVAASAALYLGYKNRPGAYQGSPSYFMDPSRADARFPIGQVPVPSALPAPLAHPDRIQAALTTYGNAFTRLLEGYYILDRNYNYDFHNRLFLRSTPLVPGYRGVGLRAVGEATNLRAAADHALQASAPPPRTDAVGALLEDVRTLAAFTFDRAPLLEQMSARFEATEAGLQHATHLYEGEGKVLSTDLGALLDKHRVALAVPAVSSVAAEFVASSRAVREAYANRIVGF